MHACLLPRHNSRLRILPPVDPPASRLRAHASRLRSSRLPPGSENEAHAYLTPRASKLTPEAGASAAGKTELTPTSRLEPEPGCRSCRLGQAAAWGRQLDLPPGWCLASKDCKLQLWLQPSVRCLAQNNLKIWLTLAWKSCCPPAAGPAG